MKAASGSIFNFARNRSGRGSSRGSGSSNRTGSGRGSDKNNKSILTRISDFLTSGAERAASRQQSKKTHTEKVGESRSPKQMTKDAKKAQKKAAKEAGKGFKDSFKDTVRAVKSAGKTLVNATGINGKQKKEQAVGKIYGITRGIGTTIAHPIKTAKEIASGIRKKAKEKGESYVGGYILGEVTQTVAAAGAAAAAGKGLKGVKAAKKTKPKKSNGLVDAGSKGGLDTSIKNIDEFIGGNKSFDDVLDDYAKVYADKINSNQAWSWDDTIPGGENLTKKQRSIIKQQAIDAGLITDIKVTKVEGMRYGFADFESAGVVKETQYLPENMWKMSDAEQFKWLDEQIGGTVDGYTWHHTEIPGKMQLVPTGIHNITTHNGGRTAGMWAGAPR